MKQSENRQSMTRRQFLQTAGIAAAGLLASSCGLKDKPAAAPASFDVKPIIQSNQVAIGRAQSYTRSVIEQSVRDVLDQIGGLADVVSKGDTVAIKTNLTGGVNQRLIDNLNPNLTIATHPEVVRALAGLVRDAGAKKVYIVESVYEWDSYVLWGYEDAFADMDAELIDLNGTAPFDAYMDVAVPGGGEIYSEFKFNPLLMDVDVFMSVAKMKCHWTCGVTHAMKNLVGLVPAKFYKLTNEHSHRSAFHGPTEADAGYRVPRIIVELNKTRPVHLSLIDGIMTTEAGEGPWIQNIARVEPGVLVAGKNPVATDSVATAIQGFDPQAASMTVPFVRADNHLALAAAAGLGTNNLDEIDVVGESIDDVLVPFAPCLA